MVDAFFSKKMIPLWHETLSYNNIIVKNNFPSNKIAHEHKIFIVPKNKYSNYDKAMIKRFENVFKSIN